MDENTSANPWIGGYQVLPHGTSYVGSPNIPGASQHSAVFPSSLTHFHDDLLSFLSYIKAIQIPIFSVGLPDVRSVLGCGASFFVNGAEMPETSIDYVTGERVPKGSVVALKRATVPKKRMSIQEGLAYRIHLLSNEVLTMKHPPLIAHPNIVRLLGIGFEVEGYESDRNVVITLVPECAELGNLAEILETSDREDRPFGYDQKLSFCVDVAHALEALHACDIVHGDVKCENVLVFETPNVDRAKRALSCKITDFGFSHLQASSKGVRLGGSPPWQAPEILPEHYYRIESAKQTDIYSFGLLVWRLMLDGDPFEPLESYEGKTDNDKRNSRNEVIAALKQQDKLIEHVQTSLKSSAVLDETHYRTISIVMERTLAKDPSRRESSISNIIKLLSPSFWYTSRQAVAPERVSSPHEIELLDIEKHYQELRKADSVVKEKIAKAYYDYVRGTGEGTIETGGAAYQLAVCYALGYGVPFSPQEIVRYLEISAMHDFQKAQDVLPRFRMVFDTDLEDYVVPLTSDIGQLSIDSSDGQSTGALLVAARHVTNSDGITLMDGQVVTSAKLLIEAVQTHDFRTAEKLLADGVPGNSSTDEGITALHYLTACDAPQVKLLGDKIVKAGGNINALARKGISMGGTPLMWAVSEGRLEQSKLLLDLGADPTTSDSLGLCALSLSARLHLHAQLRLLLMHTKPIEVEKWIYQLLLEAASGESRFSRIIRHGKDSETAPIETFRILHAWHSIFSDLQTFKTMLLSAIGESLSSPFGSSNTDIQIKLLDFYSIAPALCAPILRESILTDNKTIFDHFISRQVPANKYFADGKTLLHLCARNPNNTTTTRYFGEEILKQRDVEIDARDLSGQTPFMDALLARKWDLARFLLYAGANGVAVTNDGYTVIGLIIQTMNLGAAKWALRYSDKGDWFREHGFMIHPAKKISALQEAARLKLPRAHGMKTEVSGLFLYLLFHFKERHHIDFRSDGILPNSCALDIAAANGNVHAVKALVKGGAATNGGKTALAQAKLALQRLENGKDSDEDAFLAKKNLERCVFIIENWAKDPVGTSREADKWTKLRTIDEDTIKKSWEVVAWHWKTS